MATRYRLFKNWDTIICDDFICPVTEPLDGTDGHLQDSDQSAGNEATMQQQNDYEDRDKTVH